MKQNIQKSRVCKRRTPITTKQKVVPKDMSCFFKKDLKISISLNLLFWWPALLCLIFSLASVIIIGTMLTLKNFSLVGVSLLLGVNLMFIFMFIYTIFKLEKTNKENIDKEKKLESIKYSKKYYNAVKRMQYEISGAKHRLYYVMIKIQNLVKEEKYKEIINVSEKYKITIPRQAYIIMTNNELFDSLIGYKINSLISNGKNINMCLNIPENSSFYNDYNFIDFIIELLNSFENYNNLVIYIQNKSDYTLISIYSLELVVSEKTEGIINDYFKKKNGMYNYNDSTEVRQLKIIIGEE